jgi:hypothetical protein
LFIQEDFLFIILSDGSTQNHRNMAGKTNLQKKLKFPQKKYNIYYFKTEKGQKFVWGQRIIFSRDRQKFQAAPQLLENIPKKIKLNQN